MTTRPFEVLHLFLPPGEDGGGLAARMGRFGSLERAIEVGTVRLLRNADPSPDDRIQIKAHIPGHRSHPIWLYRDGDGRVCMWRKHESQPHDLWGHVS